MSPISTEQQKGKAPTPVEADGHGLVPMHVGTKVSLPASDGAGGTGDEGKGKQSLSGRDISSPGRELLVQDNDYSSRGHSSVDRGWKHSCSPEAVA